jgi:hypothetical protein
MTKGATTKTEGYTDAVLTKNADDTTASSAFYVVGE